MIDPSMPFGLFLLTGLGTFAAIRPDIPMRLVLSLPRPLRAPLLLSYRMSDVDPLSPAGLFIVRIGGVALIAAAAWLAVIITRLGLTSCGK